MCFADLFSYLLKKNKFQTVDITSVFDWKFFSPGFAVSGLLVVPYYTDTLIGYI